MKEVRSLASLDHTNIIRYYQSWVEHDMIDAAQLNAESINSMDAPLDDETFTETSIDSSITAITYTDYNFTCDSDASDVEIERQFAENVNNVPSNIQSSLENKKKRSNSPLAESPVFVCVGWLDRLCTQQDVHVCVCLVGRGVSCVSCVYVYDGMCVCVCVCMPASVKDSVRVSVCRDRHVCVYVCMCVCLHMYEMYVCTGVLAHECIASQNSV
jgi:hypothetical protein